MLCKTYPAFLFNALGADLMEEHLREIRTLRRRLEDSIQTNDRLRQQLEERLASSGPNGGQRFTHSNEPSLCVYAVILLCIFACLFQMYLYFLLPFTSRGSAH